MAQHAVFMKRCRQYERDIINYSMFAMAYIVSMDASTPVFVSIFDSTGLAVLHR